MRTSLNKIEEVEKFLADDCSPQEKLLFAARRIVDPALDASVVLQQKVYALISWYGRKKVKTEIRATERKLFEGAEHAAFRARVDEIFKD